MNWESALRHWYNPSASLNNETTYPIKANHYFDLESAINWRTSALSDDASGRHYLQDPSIPTNTPAKSLNKSPLNSELSQFLLIWK